MYFCLLLSIYAGNEIDEEVFLELDLSTAKELIGPLGLRMKFVKHLQELKVSVSPQNNC